MAKKFKRSYKIAIKTALYITIFLSVVLGGFAHFTTGIIFGPFFAFILITYFVSFFIIQYRVEKFIYKRIKKIYDNVSILDSTTLSPSQVTTDMASLTREVEKFTKDKKLEIDTLKVREAYRKEF